MNGNERNGARRGGPGGPRRGSTRVVARIGWVVAIGILWWIDPLLVVLLGLVVGIGWLRRTDADPVHWGPVPREGDRVRPSDEPGSSGPREQEAASVPTSGAGHRPWP